MKLGRIFDSNIPQSRELQSSDQSMQSVLVFLYKKKKKQQKTPQNTQHHKHVVYLVWHTGQVTTNIFQVLKKMREREKKKNSTLILCRISYGTSFKSRKGNICVKCYYKQYATKACSNKDHVNLRNIVGKARQRLLEYWSISSKCIIVKESGIQHVSLPSTGSSHF